MIRPPLADPASLLRSLLAAIAGLPARKRSEQSEGGPGSSTAGSTRTGRSTTATACPPEYAEQDRDVLEQAGRRGRPRAKARSRPRKPRAKSSRGEGGARRAEAQAQRDRVLLQTYQSVQEIELLRDNRLEPRRRAAHDPGTVAVEPARAARAGSSARARAIAPYSTEAERAAAAGRARRGPRAHRQRHADPASTNSSKRAARRRETCAPDFDADITRYQELRRDQRADALSRSCRTRPRRARLASNASTISSSTCTTGTTTICAMRSPGSIVNGAVAAVPARHHHLPLVVGVDQPDEVAEHDAVLVAEPGARQQHGREPGVVEVDRDAGRHELGLPGLEHERRVEAGAQVQPGRAVASRRAAAGSRGRCADRGSAPSGAARLVAAGSFGSGTDAISAPRRCRPAAAGRRAGRATARSASARR